MDALANCGVFLFEGFRLDLRTHTLFRRDEAGVFVPIAIGSRALEVLDLLLRRAGDLVSRDEFMAAVWPATAVEDSNLNMQVAVLRRVLDERRADGSCIQTIPGRGYRFTIPVTKAEAAVAASFPIDGNGSAGSIAAYRETPPRSVVCGPDDPTPAPAWGTRPWPRSAVMATPAVVAFCLVAAAIAAVNWRSPPPWEFRSAPRLSIVVLPFADLSSGHDQQYFADGITEDLTTDLSRITDMFVISANTALTYRNKPVEAKQIGRELGVRYILEGSVQQSGNQVRINAQLIEADSDLHLWAQRFDGDVADLFALQNEITSRIAVALNIELISKEAARSTENPDALDFIFRARAAIWKPRSPTSLSEAMSLLEHALSLDPSSTEAKSLLVGALFSRVVDFGSNSEPQDVNRAEELAAEGCRRGAPQRDGTLCQRRGATFASPMRGSHARV